MARIQTVLGNLGEAQVWIDEAVRLTPTHAGVRFAQCNGLIELGATNLAEQCFDMLEQDLSAIVDTPYRRVNLLWFLSDADRLTQLGEQLEAEPTLDSNAGLIGWLYRISAVNERIDKSRELSRIFQKDLYDESDIEVIPAEIERYAFGGYLLYTDGDIARANYIFDQALDTMQSMHRTRSEGYQVWDIFIHVTRGDKEKAIATLREAIDSGWRDNWWRLKTWLYRSMADQPEWNAMISELEADILIQREWYEENKGKPLP